MHLLLKIIFNNKIMIKKLIVITNNKLLMSNNKIFKFK